MRWASSCSCFPTKLGAGKSQAQYASLRPARTHATRHDTRHAPEISPLINIRIVGTWPRVLKPPPEGNACRREGGGRAAACPGGVAAAWRLRGEGVGRPEGEEINTTPPPPTTTTPHQSQSTPIPMHTVKDKVLYMRGVHEIPALEKIIYSTRPQPHVLPQSLTGQGITKALHRIYQQSTT